MIVLTDYFHWIVQSAIRQKETNGQDRSDELFDNDIC